VVVGHSTAMFVVLSDGAEKRRQLTRCGKSKIQIDSEFVFPIDSISEFQLGFNVQHWLFN
jgi:hypothetical protein